jgi:hypothetical protein
MGLSLKKLVKGAGKIIKSVAKKPLKALAVGVATAINPGLGAAVAKGIGIAGTVKSLGRTVKASPVYTAIAPPMGAMNTGAVELHAAQQASTVTVDRGQLRDLLASAYEGGRRSALGI